ncbi:MAG: hypothetical protein RSE41_09130 [Clostridia bacterium]
MSIVLKNGEFNYIGNDIDKQIWVMEVNSIGNDEYKLIHWLSGKDALVNNVWVDKVGTKYDNESFDFEKIGNIKKNDDNYYIDNGDINYFINRFPHEFKFGKDWYMQVTLKFNDIITNTNYEKSETSLDLGSVTFTPANTFSIGLGRIYKDNKTIFNSNCKAYFNNANTLAYSTNELPINQKIVLKSGIKPINETQSKSFVEYNGVVTYGNVPFVTYSIPNGSYANWINNFYIGRGVATKYSSKDINIYDIKIYKNKKEL